MMTIKKINFALAGIAIVVIAVAGFSVKSRNVQKQADSEQLETIRVAQFGKEKFLLYLPLYLAMEAGYFAEQGLTIELIFAGNDDQVFAAVASGSVDFGVGDPVFTAIAQERGFKAKTIATLITNLGLSGYAKNPAIPNITSTNDLAGLRIGSFPEPSTTYTLLSELIQANTALSNTQIVQAAMGAQAALIESNRADIAIDLEPAVSIAENQGYRVVMNLADLTDSQVITGLMATEAHIAKHPEQTQGMVMALEKALFTLTNQPQKAHRIAKALFPDLSAVVVENAVNRMLSHQVYPTSTIVRDALWQRTLSTRMASNELSHRQPTAMSVDNRFAKTAQATVQ